MVRRLLRSLAANSEYSVLHCFLTVVDDMERVNQTPKNLKESLGDIGVMVNLRVVHLKCMCKRGRTQRFVNVVRSPVADQRCFVEVDFRIVEIIKFLSNTKHVSKSFAIR